MTSGPKNRPVGRDVLEHYRLDVLAMHAAASAQAHYLRGKDPDMNERAAYQSGQANAFLRVVNDLERIIRTGSDAMVEV